MFPNLACVPREINRQGLRKEALNFLACLGAPQGQSFSVDVSLGHQGNACALCQVQPCRDQPLRSFCCVATCTVMRVHTSYILAHPKHTRSRYHASVFLLKVLCTRAPGNFCTLSTWPAHLPVLCMYVSTYNSHPFLRFRVTKEYWPCHPPFLPSFQLYLPALLFLPVSFLLVSLIPVSEPPSE